MRRNTIIVITAAILIYALWLAHWWLTDTAFDPDFDYPYHQQER